MLKRMDQFEQILRTDREQKGGPDASAGIKPNVVVDGSGIRTGDTGPSGSSGSSPAKDPSATPAKSSVADVIKHLKRNVETPQEIYVERLEGWEEVDEDMWAAQFPPGYRERLGGTAMGEVYSTGQTAKKWAKAFIKDRGLDEDGAARELIATYAAIDALILQDRDYNPVNSVAFERLVRKGYGIVRGYRNVHCVNDWRRPKTMDKGQKWESKVDEEIWARVDPAKAGKEEFAFVNRRVENEVRTEMDREAQWLKARNKLTENKGAGTSSISLI